MSSSFHTLEGGMRIILYLVFLQETFAFPTSCSLQMHWRWARRGPKSSERCLRRPARRTRVRQPPAGETPDRRGRGVVSFHKPLIPVLVSNPPNPEGRGLQAQICAAPQLQPGSLSLVSGSLNRPVSDFLTPLPLFLEISHPCHQTKARPFCLSVS